MENIKDRVLGRMKENYYFNILYGEILANSNLNILIKDEEETLEDEFNVNKSLTEFRGYQCKDDIVVFATRYETEESVEFIIFHEIFHYIIDRDLGSWCLMKMLNQDFLFSEGLISKEDLKVNYVDISNYVDAYETDEIHEAMPEEKMCNDFARFITKINRDRLWWRENIAKVDKLNKLAEIAFEDTNLAPEAQE